MERKPGVPLTQEGRETGITFNEASKMAEVATYNARWQKAIEKMGIKPYEVDEIGGCRFYHIPKARLPLPRAVRRLKPEQKARATKNLALARRQQGEKRRQQSAQKARL